MTNNLPAVINNSGLVLNCDQMVPVVTPVMTVTSWTVTLGQIQASVRYATDHALEWSYIGVDAELAEMLDAELAALAQQERDLEATGDRWLDRGIDPEVDALCDRLNKRIAETHTTIAMAVLGSLPADVVNASPLLFSKVEFDAFAGCTTCKCTAGVKAPHARRNGAYLQIQISATPPTVQA